MVHENKLKLYKIYNRNWQKNITWIEKIFSGEDIRMTSVSCRVVYSKRNAFETENIKQVCRQRPRRDLDLVC